MERGDLFAVSGAQSRVACSVRLAGSEVEIQHRFVDGSVLSGKFDSSIEYAEQRLLFASPRAMDGLAVLSGAERNAFGAEGCGVRWDAPESSEAVESRAATESTYRGEVCNCQARMTRDGEGGVLALSFSSSC